MGAVTGPRVQKHLDCGHCFKCGDLDAERGRSVADDHVDHIPGDGRAHANRHLLACVFGRDTAAAIADIVDRRRMLLFTQTWMFAAALGLSIITYSGWITPKLLLAFTFALGIGSAVNMPVWQTVVPRLVPKSQLPTAVALNSVSLIWLAPSALLSEACSLRFGGARAYFS